MLAVVAATHHLRFRNASAVDLANPVMADLTEGASCRSIAGVQSATQGRHHPIDG
jgi:hypothetical protein